MRRVGARASRDVDDGAGVAPILGAERRVVDLEFGDRVDRRLERDLEFERSFRLIPLIMKLTAVSRLPADMNENAPWPRRGALRPAFCGGVTPPGISGPRSTKWRPFSGISCTVRSAITWPTDTRAVSTRGAAPVTVSDSVSAPTLSLKSMTMVCATPRSISRVCSWNPSMRATTV